MKKSYEKRLNMKDDKREYYENCCRKMVITGLNCLDKHPKADSKFHGWKNIYAIIQEDTKDAKDHICFIRKDGWEKFKKGMEGENKK